MMPARPAPSIIDLGALIQAEPDHSNRQQLLGARREDFADRRLNRFGNQVERLEHVVAIVGADRARHREGQSIDAVALETEMRLAEARGEPGAEDLEIAFFERQPELDAVPVDAGDPMAFASRDCGAAEAAD